MDYFDISPIISESTAVFPGDVPFRRTVGLDFSKGDHLLLSSLQTSVHIGAHADGPNHYSPDGEGIGERDLSFYMGRCQVVTVNVKRGERVHLKDLNSMKLTAPRILFRTLSFPDPTRWNSDFCSLSPELVRHLAKSGARLVGIDTPSVDPETSEALESHHAIFESGMAILEGLVLEHVPDGIYSLMALPLRLQGFDASPVRAILFKNSTMFDAINQNVSSPESYLK